MSYLAEAKKLLSSGKIGDMVESGKEMHRVVGEIAQVVTQNSILLEFIARKHMTTPQKTAFETLMRELKK